MEKQIEFEVEGTTPLMMHKFNGQRKAKELKNLTEEEQAEAHAYRTEDGFLAAPAAWFKGCIVNEYIRRVSKGKMEKRNEITPAIRIEPWMLSLGIKDYKVDVRSVPSGSGYRGGCRDFCVRPLIEKWKCSGMIITSLDASELKDVFEKAGQYVGVGSNRPNGYGRFKVTKFKVIE